MHWTAIAVLLLMGMISGQAWGIDCVPASITLSTQPDVDDFQSNHGPCDRVTGQLTIDGADIENVDGLSALTSIGDGIRFLFATSLASVDGLASLNTIDGSLFYTDSNSLTQVDGLSNLVTVGGSVHFQFNDALTNLNGLSALTSAGSLRLEFNTALQNIDGLSGLISVGTDIQVTVNPKLDQCAGLTRLLDSVDDGDPGPGPGLDGIPDVGNQAIFGDNKAGCNLISEIMTIFKDGFESPPNTFITVDTDLGGGGIGTYCSIAIGSAGFPLVSYRDNINSALKVAACGDADCSMPLITISTVDGLATNSGIGSSIAIGADGLPVIGYLEQFVIPVELKVAKCNDAACIGGDETLTTVVNPTAISQLDLAVGDDTFPVIAFGLGGELKVIKCNDTACTGRNESIVTIADLGDQGRLHLSIAVGVDSFPVITYFDAAAQALKVAKCNDQACTGGDETIVTIDDPESDLSRGTSIAIGSDGFPVISYGSSTSNTLKVAKCGDISCSSPNVTISTVDNDGTYLASQTSIAIGSDGFPIISYQDSEDQSLKVAKCNDLACSGGDELVRTLDIGARHTSIAIGSDGLPVISYCNSGTNDFALKVVHCGTSACL